MLGAIIGDIVGSRFEFDNGNKSREFELFTKDCDFTDDTVMTVAVAEALLDAGLDADEKTVKENLIRKMKYWGHKIPNAGYGGMFATWIFSRKTEPYGSYGNGSAMRVSPVGWLYDTIERTREVARWTAEVTHNHPEGIKGAESTASAIFLARNRASMEEIEDYIIKEFGYDLSRTLDAIRPTYHHVEDCMRTMPEAFTCFFESGNFEECIRNVMYIGGDTDTLGAIAGAIAEAFWGIPVLMVPKAKEYLTKDLISVLDRFDRAVNGDPGEDPYSRNKSIKLAIERFHATHDVEDLIYVLEVLEKRIFEGGEAPTPVLDVNNVFDGVDLDNVVVGKPVTLNKEMRLRKDTVRTAEGEEFFPLFTDREELDKQPTTNININCPIGTILEDGLNSERVQGVVINPFGKPLMLNKEVLKILFRRVEDNKEGHEDDGNDDA